ncbi:hypothetical protein HIM_06959 [Hirsutella minnesotensis 3608]|uniref:Nucleoporin Nup159/Nup146 N-terminal domain-containing protein n=1 Tax=Hirsutella minnesotensis 3608 TaxID=1043627 RepID=A0A0F7ZID6_9HYPO|nr:hypothetical protein HIM_06959 [Hirsutella minnesotensis 3608]
MASPFSNSANVAGGAAAGAVNSGPDLETIQTEALGFLSVAGDAKVRLTTAWSSLPASTSSLLSIASRKGLVAAAGPDQLVIAKTESVRKAFESPKDGESDTRSFEPQLVIPMPMRISQLAFTADENFLVLSAESGGGLAVYEVQSLLQGSTSSAFELSTNGESLRALIPNPTPEKAELCAFVTNNGNLHMASLKERKISNALRSQVSCISWSAKGKQLCAGLADGSIHQMTPEGDARAEIPKPPSLGNCHVSSLTWLENNLFLAIHTTTNETPPASIYHIITRESSSNFTFQKINDPVEPFGSDKTPHHSILRLRDFPPDLQDLLIVGSTASTEVGLLTRTKAPLTADKPANSVTGVFTHTELLDDTKRPTLPMTDSMDDSTPVGIALDLSSKDKVYKPIPSEEELEESPSPLPGLWVLTHEGILCSWWIVYTDSIMKGTSYPGLAAAEGTASMSIPAHSTPAVSATPFSSSNATAFGAAAAPAAAFGASSQLGQKQSPWGASVSTPTANTGGAVFGASTFGNSPNSASSFAKASPIGFGQSSQLGIRTSSPWATGGVAAPSFGQSGFSGFAKSSNNQSPFGAASPSPSAGGFSGFAKQGGFGSVAADNRGGSNVFGSGSKLAPTEPFGIPTGSKNYAPKDNVFGSTPFKLESSFKADPSQVENDSKPATTGGSSLFGSDFNSLVGQQPRASTPPARDEDMDTTEPIEQTPQAAPPSMFSSNTNQESTTPTTTPAPGRFGFASSPAPGTSLFGQSTKLGQSGGLFGSGEQTPKPSGGLFGSGQQTSQQSTGTSGLFSLKKDEPIPSIEKNTEPETPKIKTEDDSPLPPDTVSKATPTQEKPSSSATTSTPNQMFGTPSLSSKAEAAPLPPDFTKAKAPNAADEASSLFGKSALDKSSGKSKTFDDAPLPPDFITAPKAPVPEAPLPPDPTRTGPDSRAGGTALPLDTSLPKASDQEASSVLSGPEESEEGSDLGEDEASEGSGVDVAKDLSPTATAVAPTPGFTPQSSFGGPAGTTPATARAEQDRPRTLFGEVSRNAPLFPRPNAGSPRSPSPVRNAATQRVFRMDATRSVSAPGMASHLLGTPKSQSVMGRPIVSSEKLASAEESFLQQHRKLKARQEAEEARPLIDEEDDEVQKVLASEVEGTLELDEFIAHSNVAPPAQDSIPSQVEAVYRDINSMIDTLGLNARAVKAFLKGHTENRKEEGRNKDDLEIPDDWVLCEVSELGAVLDSELYGDLEDGRVQDLDGKLGACQELAREMQRLRARQEDVKRIVMARLDPDQVQVARSLPLSAEQAAQQNELRREYGNFSKLLAQAEEALTLLKTRLAAVSGSSGRGGANVPTVDAVIRTITKMTSMAEKRSGDIDVLETQMRKMRLGSVSREGSPMVTPQTKKSVMMMTPSESTPSRTFRHSLSGSVSLGSLARATPPRKKLSGFSREEKSDLMDKRARRQAVLAKFRSSVEKKGVSVWNMEDIE